MNSKYIKYKILADKSLSDKEKYSLLYKLNNDNDIRQILSVQDAKLNKIIKNNRNAFIKDVGANVVGDAIWSSLLFLGKKLF